MSWAYIVNIFLRYFSFIRLRLSTNLFFYLFVALSLPILLSLFFVVMKKDLYLQVWMWLIFKMFHKYSFCIIKEENITKTVINIVKREKKKIMQMMECEKSAVAMLCKKVSLFLFPSPVLFLFFFSSIPFFSLRGAGQLLTSLIIVHSLLFCQFYYFWKGVSHCWIEWRMNIPCVKCQ